MGLWQMIKTWFHRSKKSSEVSDFKFKNAKTVDFRFATEADIKQLLAVEREVYEEIPWTASHFKHEINENRYACFIVAEESGIILGYIGLRWDRKHTDFHISNFIVRKTEQGQGLGSELFDNALELSKILEISKMSLEVALENRGAQGFYRKRGFESERILSHYYSDGNDALEMLKEI